MMEELLQINTHDKILKVKKEWFLISRLNLIFILPLLLFQFKADEVFRNIDFYCGLFIFVILVFGYQIYLKNLYLLLLEAILNLICFIVISVYSNNTIVNSYSIVFHMENVINCIYFYVKLFILYKELENTSTDEEQQEYYE